jgi:hypothetical protein
MQLTGAGCLERASQRVQQIFQRSPIDRLHEVVIMDRPLDLEQVPGQANDDGERDQHAAMMP